METKEQFLERYNAAVAAGATQAELQAMIDEFEASEAGQKAREEYEYLNPPKEKVDEYLEFLNSDLQDEEYVNNYLTPSVPIHRGWMDMQTGDLKQDRDLDMSPAFVALQAYNYTSKEADVWHTSGGNIADKEFGSEMEDWYGKQFVEQNRTYNKGALDYKYDNNLSASENKYLEERHYQKLRYTAAMSPLGWADVAKDLTDDKKEELTSQIVTNLIEIDKAYNERLKNPDEYDDYMLTPEERSEFLDKQLDYFSMLGVTLNDEAYDDFQKEYKRLNDYRKKELLDKFSLSELSNKIEERHLAKKRVNIDSWDSEYVELYGLQKYKLSNMVPEAVPSTTLPFLFSPSKKSSVPTQENRIVFSPNKEYDFGDKTISGEEAMLLQEVGIAQQEGLERFVRAHFSQTYYYKALHLIGGLPSQGNNDPASWFKPDSKLDANRQDLIDVITEKINSDSPSEQHEGWFMLFLGSGGEHKNPEFTGFSAETDEERIIHLLNAFSNSNDTQLFKAFRNGFDGGEGFTYEPEGIMAIDRGVSVPEAMAQSLFPDEMFHFGFEAYVGGVGSLFSGKDLHDKAGQLTVFANQLENVYPDIREKGISAIPDWSYKITKSGRTDREHFQETMTRIRWEGISGLEDMAVENIKTRAYAYASEYMGPKLRRTLGKDYSQSKLREFEQKLYREYDTPADLTGDGYYNENKEGWDGFTEAFGGEFGRAWRQSWDGMATLTENTLVLADIMPEYRAKSNQRARQRGIDAITKELRVSTRSLSDKFNSGDFTGWITDVGTQTGGSIPMMGAALVTGFVTRGNSKAVAVVTSAMGAASVYSQNKDTEWFKNLSGAEATGFVLSSGIAEGLPALVGAKIFSGQGFLAKRLASTPMGKAVMSGSGKQGFLGWTRGLIIGAGLGATEEALTEGVTAGWQYTAERWAKNQAGEYATWNYDDWWAAVKEGALAGLGMGGVFSGTGTLVRTVSTKSLGSLRTIAQIKELQNQYSQAESRTERAAIGRKIVDAVAAHTKNTERRQALMEYLAETDDAKFNELVNIHNEVEVLAEEYSRSDTKRRREINKELKSLLNRRADIEGELDSALQTDAALEARVLGREAKKAGERRRDYGGLFEKGTGKITVDKSNLGAVAKIIEKLTKLDVSPYSIMTEDGRAVAATTGERIVKGMQNALNVVRALSSLGDFAIEMYRDYDTYINDLMEEGSVVDEATGETRKMTREEAQNAAGRGMWTGSGKIKLFLPAMLENTAYHEGYHDFVLQTVGEKAAIGLAKKLFQALPKNLVQKYGSFLSSYGSGMGNLVKILENKNVSDADKRQAADEFLMEFLSDLSAGNVSIEVQKGIIRQFMDFLAPHLGRIGIKGIPDAKISDVVKAINQLTSEVAEGKRLEGQKALSTAVARAGYATMTAKMGISVDDEIEEGYDQAKAQAMTSKDSDESGKKIDATLMFLVGKSRVSGRYPIRKSFNSNQHIENFINYMEERKGWVFDEMFINKGEYEGREFSTDEPAVQPPKPKATLVPTDSDIYSVQAYDFEGFVEIMDKALEKRKELSMNLGIQVDPLTVEDIKQIKEEGGVLYMTIDNKAGAYIKRDGYMGGLFKDPDSSYRSVAKAMQDKRNGLAKNSWGMKSAFMSSYATDLERQYVENGWKPVARVEFNPDYAPEGWDAENSPLINKPDIVFYVEGKGEVGGGKMMDSYDEAYSAARDLAQKDSPASKAQAMPDASLQEDATVSFEDASGITPAMLSSRAGELKLPESQRQKRNKVVTGVLNKYELGEINQEQYIAAVRENMPIKAFDEVPEIPSLLDVAASLKTNQVNKGIIGSNKQVEDGYYVGLRLDVPAYNEYDTWVVSVHQGKKAEARTPYLGGKTIGYGQTGVITNVTFDSTPVAALNIARSKGKTTIARMFGDWRNEDPKSVRERAMAIMEGPEYNSDYKEIGKMDGWIQVGMNPFRHSWFYDKRDGRPIAEASEVIQIGALVLAKDAVKISESDERFNAKSAVSGKTIKFQRPGSIVDDVNSLAKTDKVGIFDFEYSANTSQMDEWIKSGVVRQEEMSFIEGMDVLAHSPDNMMVGSVSVGDRVIAENGGGLFYSARTGDVWAVAGESTGRNMAKELNELRSKSENGKAYIVLISGSRVKHVSSTGGVMSFAAIGFEMVEQGIITKSELKEVLRQTIKETEVISEKAQISANEARVKDGKKPKPIRKGVRTLSDLTGTMQALFDRFYVEFASPYQSTFEQRKAFVDRFATNLGALVKRKADMGDAESTGLKEAYKKMFGISNMNTNQFGSTIKNFFFDNFQEKILQGGQKGEIYAAIEVSSDVELVTDPDPTASYPLKLVNTDPDAPAPKTIVFKTMRRVDGSMISRSSRAMGKQVGDTYINSKGKKATITTTVFEAMSGQGVTSWGRMTMKAPVPVDAIAREVVSMTETRTIGVRAKAQGNIMKMLADAIDSTMPTPTIEVRRGKLIINSSRAELWNRSRDEIVDMLVASGMSKENAVALYKQAKAYKQGRLAGKNAADKNARNTLGKRNRELSSEAKSLKKELRELTQKSETVDEFLTFAIALIDERMKDRGKQPFSKREIQRFFKIVRQAHRSSSKRIAKDGGAEVMDSFVEKIIDIFDKQDAQQAMRDYMASISAARKLQDRIAKLTKRRKRNESLKSIGSYVEVLRRLADINPAMLSPTDVMDFIKTLNAAVTSVSKVKTEFDAEEERVVGVAPNRTSVAALTAMANDFRALEEIGRNARMVAKAEAAAQKNGTEFEEEYSKLIKAERLKQVSSTRKAVLKYIEDNPRENLDASNPADLEYILEQLAENKALLEEQSKEAIINDVLLPMIAFNLDRLLADEHIAEILGVYWAFDYDVNALSRRLSKLDKVTLASIEFKLDDYLMNDSTMGLGTVAARVKGKIDYADGIKSNLLDKGIVATGKPLLAALDTVDSLIRFMFKTDSKTIAKIRVLIGFAAIERSFAKADMIHAMTADAISDKMNEIEGKRYWKRKKGSVSTVYDNAIMQIFSMARQMPVLEEGVEGQNAADWFLALRDVMLRTIEHNEQQKDVYSKKDIAEMRRAYEFLFENFDEDLPASLDNLMGRVGVFRPDLVEMVDFMVDIHSTMEDIFANYVERYLGKTLVRESQYTPFSVMSKMEQSAVDDAAQLRQAMMEGMRTAALSNVKKTAGSSYERNPKSISSKSNIIGLNFLSINERTLRENTILSYTIGDVMALQSAFSSEEMTQLIPDNGRRNRLHQKLMQYISQDIGSAPSVFKSRFIVNERVPFLGGRRFRNPLQTIRIATIVRAFGGVFVQTLKQSTVLVSVIGNMKNPMQSIPYLLQTWAEIWAYAARTGGFKDSKLTLEANGRYRLLQNSPVFSRDYEAGNIDPYTGSIETETSWFVRTRDKLASLALKNLKSTDKAAAIASWFAYYADFMVSESLAESVWDIDWEAEANNPNAEALSYADTMVSKDQAASTARQAADVYKDGRGFAGAVTAFARNIILPFARHTINKKRAIGSDASKLLFGRDKKARREGGKNMVFHIAELTAFQAIGYILLPALTQYVMGLLGYDDEEKESEYKDNPWMRVGGGVVKDLVPLPPMGYTDDLITENINRYFLFPIDSGMGWTDDGYDDGYEAWKNTSPNALPTYQRKSDLSAKGALNLMLGPYGQFVTDAYYTYQNLNNPDNKVISKSGREYYVRPEDKEQMDTHFALSFVLFMTQTAGFSSKELDMIVRKMDDLPRERAFSSEEELMGYEYQMEWLLENSDENKQFLKFFEGGEGSEDVDARIEQYLNSIADDPDSSPQEVKKALTKIKKGAKTADVEFYMKPMEGYSEHIRDIRGIYRSTSNAKEYASAINIRKEMMSPEEFANFKALSDVYMSAMSPGRLAESEYYTAHGLSEDLSN